MTNNEYFRQILFLTGLRVKPELTKIIFELGGATVSLSAIQRLRVKDGGKNQKPMTNELLEQFFSGLYEYRDLQAERGLLTFNFSLFNDEPEPLKVQMLAEHRREQGNEQN